MKEISKELEKRRCIVCVKCGSIYEGAKGIFKKQSPCSECGNNKHTYWITPTHSWTSGIGEVN